MRNRQFKLDARLKACADFVRGNAKIADIGTDHAYLPIYLINTKKVKKAIATDIKEGPLLNAKKSVEKYNLTEAIDLRLSDGLKNISPSEVDDIIISGLGGEIIRDILSEVEWLEDSKKRLILQPMSMEEKVREFLYARRFKVISEKVVISGNKVYIVIYAKFSGENYPASDMYPYIGTLGENLTPENKIYIHRKIKSLSNRLKGLAREEDLEPYYRLKNVIMHIQNLLAKGENK
ncbi:MAG: SAM-dependent methyltransferase [Clostridia bacterium]|nr:SAM-dependent methyltransferase [Clostridia bacterium]